MATPIIRGRWADIDDIASNFQMKFSEFLRWDVLLAVYGGGAYDGQAFVLVTEKATGKLFEVNASHCSCYGLEGQWKPEETTIKALRYRMNEGFLGDGSYEMEPFKDELIGILNALEGD